MSLITDLQERIEEQTALAKVVSNHTNPSNPMLWRTDTGDGKEATFLEAVLLEIQQLYKKIGDLNCQGEWCGKSPNRHDDGLCGVCKMQKEMFIDKLEG